MDDRTKPEQADELRTLADRLVTFKSPGHCEVAYKYVPLCSGDFVLLVSDDEEPSPDLWTLAMNPPSPSRFGVAVMPIVNSRLYRPDIGWQERLFWKEGWRWTDGFEGKSESPAPIVATNAVLWHYHLEAPREEREAKAKRYADIDAALGRMPVDHRTRLIWEERPDGLAPIPKHLRAQLLRSQLDPRTQDRVPTVG